MGHHFQDQVIKTPCQKRVTTSKDFDFKTCHKVTAIKTVWYWQKDSYIGQ
jgi:hypothetical protein